MQLFVRTLDGRIRVAQVGRGQTVRQLRQEMVRGEERLWKDVYVVHAGRFMADTCVIDDLGIPSCSTVTLGVRLKGGGGDGGATGAESRDCYLQMYAEKKPDKVDPKEARLARWTRCTLSGEALKPPCVMDLLGNLYNKEALVQALLTKHLPKKLRYIRGLKDLVNIHLSSIPGIQPDDENKHTKFQCPIIGQEFNGNFRFVALRSCGHVLSSRAMKEVQSSSCVVCYTPFENSDLIVINGTEEEVTNLRSKMEEEQVKSRELRKEKKATEIVSEKIHHESVKSQTLDTTASFVVKRKVHSVEAAAAPVVAELRPKGSDLIQPSKKFKAAESLLPQNATKSVFASIFTSSSSGKLKETYSCRSLPLGRN